MLTVGILIWGIIAFWGTTWATWALVCLILKLMWAAYKVGKEN